MIIEPKHFEYLVLQCGDISDERHDLDRWKSAYAKRIRAQLDTYVEAIKRVRSRLDAVQGKGRAATEACAVLDIGGGLGGLHTLVNKAFPEGYSLAVVDGIDDPPVHRNSFLTFNNATVAKDFLAKNGLLGVEYYSSVPSGIKYDFVLSTFAYGFHIHPGNYIDDLKKAVHDQTVLVFDVRRSKKEWLRDFVEAFGPPKVLHSAEKYVRVMFRG